MAGTDVRPQPLPRDGKRLVAISRDVAEGRTRSTTTVSELARRDVVTTDPATTIGELAFTMANERVGSVVITEGEGPVGIVTDRDIALDVYGSGCVFCGGAVAAEDFV